MTPMDLFLYILAAGMGLLSVTVIGAIVTGILRGWVTKK